MLPKTFLETMKNLLDSEFPDFLEALHLPYTRGIRLHRVSVQGSKRKNGEHTAPEPAQNSPLAVMHPKTPAPNWLIDRLGDPVPWMEDGYYLSLESTLGKSVYHELGAFYIQEPSAMAVASAVNAQPGERVLDLCAAPGGKTTAIGRQMQGQGVLVANEIHPARVLALAQNLERTGVPAVVTNENPVVLAKKWPRWFDAILVDAPCSGEGMFRKDPEAIKQWHESSPTLCAARQREILGAALQMLKPGGRLVYSTCTFNPEENEKIVAWALAEWPLEVMRLPLWAGWECGRPEWANGNVQLTHTRRLWPHRGKGEGHFVSVLRLTDDFDRPSAVQNSGKSGHVQKVPRGWQDWLDNLLAAPIPNRWKLPVLRKAFLFSNEADDLPLDGVKVLRPGICLATVNKDRFEPHHQLAMALAPSAARRTHELSLKDASDYIGGHTVSPASEKGWYWLHVNGLPVGWGKSLADRMNNLYPKGLRKMIQES